MKLMLKIYWIALIISLSGCKKSDTITPVVVSESKFFIANANSQGVGSISTYKKPGGITSDAAYLLPLPAGTSESISDFQVYNGRVYVAHSLKPQIEVANIADLSQLQTITYAKPVTPNIFKHMGIVNDKIFVAERDFLSAATTQNAAFLKVINLGNSKIDSIGIVKNARITAVAVSTGRVYVAAGISPQSIYVIDANSYAAIGTIPIAGVCTEILIDKDKNILTFYNGHVTKFNGATFSMMKDKLINGAPVNVFGDDTRNNSAYGLDKDNNIIYFLAHAPQPASAPYLLKSYNIETDALDLVSTEFISAETIAFDNVDKQIVLGTYDFSAKGAIKFLSLKGEVKSQFAISGTPGAIRIDQ